jgi:hypothetical protein
MYNTYIHTHTHTHTHTYIYIYIYIYIYNTYILGNVIMKLPYRYLKQRFHFSKLEGQEGKTDLVWGLVPVGGRRT